jgi:peptidyl-prolyl cis-trans isomerase B (cyclophilin B)
VRPVVISTALLMCFATIFSAVVAQEPSPPPQGRDSAQIPQKSNVRPADAPVIPKEPFDGVPVEKMANQCVTLATEAGSIEIEMLAETAPETARNFLNLAATRVLDGTTFSRVVKDFVIQGGDLSTGPKWTVELARRAGRTIPDEPNPVKHVRGIVSMARPDTPNGATTHFFILLAEDSQLDGKFAAFGRVARGMDVIVAINQSPVEGEKPLKPVRIVQSTVAQCSK